MADRTVRVRLVADVAQYRREIASATQQTQDIRAATQEVGSGLQRAGAGMIAAGAAMAFGLYKAGQAAADLEQSVGSTEAVFHEASGTIDAFADDSVDAMGLSERAFRDATTEIGGALRRYGFSVDEAASKSIELTQIGADLAATYGGTTADAVHALARAFAGEADPAERFNLDLRASAVNAKAVELGLAASTTSVDGHARAQALLAVIMEQSADAQGQFARESDTATVQIQKASAAFENFQASVGQVIAPILGDLAGLLGEVSEGFTDLPVGMQQTIAKSAVAASGLLVLGGGVNFALGTVIKLKDNLAAASTAISALGRAGTALKFAGAVGVVAALGAGLYILGQNTTRLRVDIDDLNASLAETPEHVGEVAAFMRDFGSSIEEQARTIADQSVPAAERWLAALERTGEAAGISADEIDAARQAIDDKRTADVRATQDQARYNAEVEEAAGTTRQLTQEVERNEHAIDDWIDAVRDAPGTLLDVEEAQIRVREALADYDAALHDTEATEDDIARSRIDVQRSFMNLGQSAYDSAYAQEVAAGRASNATAAASAAQTWALGQVAGTLSPGSALRVWLDQYIAQLGRIPRTVTTDITVSGNAAGPRIGARQSGGYVGGSGSGDIVPTMLEPGEFVIRKRAAAALGPAALRRLNHAETLGLASGGYAGVPAGWSGPTITASGGTMHVTVLLDNRVLADGLVAYERDNGPVPITVKAVAR